MQMEVKPPERTLKQWCTEGKKVIDLVEDLEGFCLGFDEILKFDDNFPLSKTPSDDAQRKKMIMAVLRNIIDKTDKLTIPYKATSPSSQSINCNKDVLDPINECDSVKRLLSVLEMHSHLNLDNNIKHQSLFMQQMSDYIQFLDDYIHLISDHSHQLELINKSLDSCDISGCNYASRHHIREMKQNEDESMSFYESTMASLHFYLYHLYDCGLRIKSDTEKKKSSETDGKQVSRILPRFQNNKFNFIAGIHYL